MKAGGRGFVRERQYGKTMALSKGPIVSVCLLIKLLSKRLLGINHEHRIRITVRMLEEAADNMKFVDFEDVYCGRYYYGDLRRYSDDDLS